MILRFAGLLDADTCGNPQRPKIGDRYVLAEITDALGDEKKDVTVVLGNDWFKDVDLDADTGSSGYSEWTPGEDAKLYAGDLDVLERLDALDGQVVTLIVADEPLPDAAGLEEAPPVVKVHTSHVGASSSSEVES
jgi:hypothetical protein